MAQAEYTWCLVLRRGGLPVQRRSPIQALTDKQLSNDTFVTIVTAVFCNLCEFLFEFRVFIDIT